MTMSKRKHNIPQSHLKSFSINGKAGLRTATSTEAFINGIKVGKYVTDVKFIGAADDEPIIQVVGFLDRLDDETKTSWGLL